MAAIQIYKEMKKPTARYREDNPWVAPERMFYFWHDSLWQESTWSHGALLEPPCGLVFPVALWVSIPQRALTFASFHQVDLTSSQLQIDQTPSSFYFLCFSPVTTATHDNVMFLRTYCYPTYLLPSSAHTFLHASCRHIPDRVLALVFQKKKRVRWSD